MNQQARRTVVVLDGAAHAGNALDWAVRSAHREDTELLILHAPAGPRLTTPPLGHAHTLGPPPAKRGASGPLSLSAASRWGRAVRRAQRVLGGDRVDTRLLPATEDALLEVLRPDDLVVLRRAATKRLAGSGLDQLVPRIGADVVVFPRSTSARTSGPYADHVVALVDDTATESRVLRTALAHARSTRRPLAIVRVTPAPARHGTPPAASGEPDPGSSWRLVGSEDAHRTCALGTALGDATDAVSGAATLLVTAPGGHDSGTTLDAVLDHAACPVLLPAVRAVPQQAEVR